MSERRTGTSENDVWMAGDRRASDRRQSPRVPVEMWVEESPRAQETYFQRSANLSTGGIFLDQTIPHPVGTVVSLKFTLPGEKQAIQLTGEIVGTPDLSAGGMSVKFVTISDEAQARITSFVEAFEPTA